MNLRNNEMKHALVAGILATVVSLDAGAATVYDKDGTKVDLKGDLQIQLRQKVGVDQDMYIDYDDLQVGFDVKHDTESGVQAFGTLKMDWKGQASGSAKAAVDEAFVGLKVGKMSFSIGRLDWGSDSFGVEHAYEIGDGEYAFADEGGHNSLQVVVDMDLAELILSHDLKVGDSSSASEVYLVSNPKKFQGLEVGVIFQSFNTAAVKADEEAGVAAEASETIDTIGVRAAYKIGKVSVGVDYTTNDDESVLNGAVGFPIGNATSGAVGYSMASADGGDDVGTWYANVTHSLAKSVTVFSEIGGNDKEGTDLGYLAGIRTRF